MYFLKHKIRSNINKLSFALALLAFSCIYFLIYYSSYTYQIYESNTVYLYASKSVFKNIIITVDKGYRTVEVNVKYNYFPYYYKRVVLPRDDIANYISDPIDEDFFNSLGKLSNTKNPAESFYNLNTIKLENSYFTDNHKHLALYVFKSKLEEEYGEKIIDISTDLLCNIYIKQDISPSALLTYQLDFIHPSELILGAEKFLSLFKDRNCTIPKGMYNIYLLSISLSPNNNETSKTTNIKRLVYEKVDMGDDFDPLLDNREFFRNLDSQKIRIMLSY